MKIYVINKGPYSLPKYETSGSAGMDIKANITDTIVLKSLERILIPSGLYVDIPQGYEIQIRARSGLSIKKGLTLINGIGTIDSDYRGEIKIPLVNLSNDTVEINPGERVAQMVLVKHENIEFLEVEELSETDRGKGGFGHTGI